MAEAVSDAIAGNRRRLPSWMLQVNACDKLKNSFNRDGKCSLSEEATKVQAAGSKTKSVRKNDKSLAQDAETIQKAGSLQGCETRQNTKKATTTMKETRRNEDLCTSLTACSGAKRRPKKKTCEDGEQAPESITSRDLQVKRRRTKNIEVNSAEGVDDEISLTVEDLISIAKEYVSAEKQEHTEQMAMSRNTSEINPSSLSISSSLAMSGTLLAGGSNQVSSSCINNRYGSSENAGKKKENCEVETFAGNISSTGDVAQDMLNLYLATSGTLQAGGSNQISSSCTNSGYVSSENAGRKRETREVETFAGNIGSTRDVAQDMLSLYLGPFFKKCTEQSLCKNEPNELHSSYKSNEQAKSCEISEGDAPMM